MQFTPTVKYPKQNNLSRLGSSFICNPQLKHFPQAVADCILEINPVILFIAVEVFHHLLNYILYHLVFPTIKVWRTHKSS